MPLLGLVQDVPRANRDRNAFQEFDHAALFASCTKWMRTLDDPGRVDDYLDMAMTAACSGRPGPVVLMLPRDVLIEPAPERPTPARRSRVTSRSIAPRRTRPRWRRPRTSSPPPGARVLIAGGGVHASGATAAVAALQERAVVAGRDDDDGQGLGGRAASAVARAWCPTTWAEPRPPTTCASSLRPRTSSCSSGRAPTRTAPTPGGPFPRMRPSSRSTSTATRSDATTSPPSGCPAMPG